MTAGCSFIPEGSEGTWHPESSLEGLSLDSGDHLLARLLPTLLSSLPGSHSSKNYLFLHLFLLFPFLVRIFGPIWVFTKWVEKSLGT